MTSNHSICTPSDSSSRTWPPRSRILFFYIKEILGLEHVFECPLHQTSEFVAQNEHTENLRLTPRRGEGSDRGRQRTAYFACCWTRYADFGTRFQWSDCSNSGIHLRCVTMVFKIRPSKKLSTDVLQSWWKLPPPQNTSAVVGNLN